jgi:hypothetical protein
MLESPVPVANITRRWWQGPDILTTSQTQPSRQRSTQWHVVNGTKLCDTLDRSSSKTGRSALSLEASQARHLNVRWIPCRPNWQPGLMMRCIGLCESMGFKKAHIAERCVVKCDGSSFRRSARPLYHFNFPLHSTPAVHSSRVVTNLLQLIIWPTSCDEGATMVRVFSTVGSTIIFSILSVYLDSDLLPGPCQSILILVSAECLCIPPPINII